MAPKTREEIRERAEAVVRAVKRAVNRPVSDADAELEALGAILDRTLEEIQSVETPSPSSLQRTRGGGERWREYFPVTESPRRRVTEAEMQQADAAWRAALGLGRRYRAEALRQIGPVLTPREVADRLGISTVTVNAWRHRWKLLAFRFDDHQYLYPAFQFVDTPAEGERGVLREVDAVLARLPYRSDWARVQFFVTPFPALGGKTPLEGLRSGDEHVIERVLQLAEEVGDMGAA